MQSGDRYRGFFVIHKEIIPIEKVNYSEKLNSQDPIIGFPIAYFPFCYFAVFLFFKPLAFFHQPLFLSIPLAKAYGGTGAAIGTAISLLIGNGLVMNWYYHYRIGINMIYFWGEIFKFGKSLLLPVATGTIMFLFIDLYRVIPFLICGIIYIIVFCVSMWFFGMNQYEKDLIKKPMLRLLGEPELGVR